MRMYIGIFGELHQPMRAITRVTKSRPAGDHGGELFYIPFSVKINNLRSLWDFGMGKFRQYRRVSFN